MQLPKRTCTRKLQKEATDITRNGPQPCRCIAGHAGVQPVGPAPSESLALLSSTPPPVSVRLQPAPSVLLRRQLDQLLAGRPASRCCRPAWPAPWKSCRHAARVQSGADAEKMCPYGRPRRRGLAACCARQSSVSSMCDACAAPPLPLCNQASCTAPTCRNPHWLRMDRPRCGCFAHVAWHYMHDVKRTLQHACLHVLPSCQLTFRSCAAACAVSSRCQNCTSGMRAVAACTRESR